MYIKFLHKKCTNCTNLYKVQAEKSLKIEIYVFCMYKQCTNYAKPIQLANRNRPCRFFVYKHNVQTIQNVYKC